MLAVSTNQIADILHFNDNTNYQQIIINQFIIVAKLSDIEKKISFKIKELVLAEK